MNKTQAKIFSKRNIILALLALFFVFAFLVPMFLPDKASSQYSGIKKEIAQYTVSNTWLLLSGINYASHFGTIRITVEDVSKAPEGSDLCNGSLRSTIQPDEGNHFLVKTSYRTLFGIKTGESLFHICRS